MDVHFEDFRANLHTVEVDADDTVEGLRRKVATAAGLAEDGFCMSFGGEAMGEGAGLTQLSAGDTIVLTKTQKQEALAELHALGETDITPERLETVEDPVVACLLLQAEVATVIPYCFLADTTLTTLDLSAESIVTHIRDRFLCSCTSLTSVDLSGLSNVTQVGALFLGFCTSLTTLDLAPLRNMTQIDNNFLFGCKSLTNVDLSPLSNVTQVGMQFLGNCPSLATLDLSPLSKVTQVGSYFLEACSSLTTLNLSPLSNVTRVEAHFLTNCSSLTTLDLSPLSRITYFGQDWSGTNFAAGCTSLTSIYLSGCSSVVSDEVRKCELRHLVVGEEGQEAEGACG